MADIAVSWDAAHNRADWSQAGPVLVTGNALESQILVSIYSDRIAAPDDEIPDGTGDPRGWWGDDGETTPIGSRIWLLRRAKQTQATLQRAYGYVAESLQWMVDDKVVTGFDIAASWVRAGLLGIQVIAYQQDGNKTTVLAVWQLEGNN